MKHNMEKVSTLHHLQGLEEENSVWLITTTSNQDGEDYTESLGIYSTRQKAKMAMEKYASLFFESTGSEGYILDSVEEDMYSIEALYKDYSCSLLFQICSFSLDDDDFIF